MEDYVYYGRPSYTISIDGFYFIQVLQAYIKLCWFITLHVFINQFNSI
jgi:hypothetical protein